MDVQSETLHLSLTSYQSFYGLVFLLAAGGITCSFATLTNTKNFQMPHPRNKTSFLPIIPVFSRTVLRFCCFFQYYCPNLKLQCMYFLRKYLISLFTLTIKTPVLPIEAFNVWGTNLVQRGSRRRTTTSC